MTSDLLTAYNALAEAVEGTLRQPDCDLKIASRLFDLHADLVERICAGTPYAVTEIHYPPPGSSPRTALEAMEAIASHRASYMNEREWAEQMSVTDCAVGMND